MYKIPCSLSSKLYDIGASVLYIMNSEDRPAAYAKCAGDGLGLMNVVHPINRRAPFKGRAQRVLAALVGALAATLCRLPVGVAADEIPEFAVKAAYIYKFGTFIEWPENTFADAASPATLCIVGNDPFGTTIDKAGDDQRLGTHPIVLRRMKTIERDSGCQILYVDSSDARRAAQSLEAVKGESILTITDGAQSADATGIINFVIADKRVRFEIDDQAAAVNQLTISSKLLGLAKSTKRRG